MTPTVESIWEQLAGKLRNFIRGRIRDHAAAEDVLQEVFVAIHKQLPSLRADDRLEAWIWRITRNAVAGHYRRGGRSEPLAQDFDSATVVEPDLPDLTGCIRQCVHQLEPEHRDALLLTEWREVSQKEMAKRLGLSDSGAKSRVQRAREKLKRMLLDCCEVELDRCGTVLDLRPRGQREPSCESPPLSPGAKPIGACDCDGQRASTRAEVDQTKGSPHARTRKAKRPPALSLDGHHQSSGGKQKQKRKRGEKR